MHTYWLHPLLPAPGCRIPDWLAAWLAGGLASCLAGFGKVQEWRMEIVAGDWWLAAETGGFGAFGRASRSLEFFG